MMEDKVLTIEQMKHLRELGCDTSNASMKFISIYPSCDCIEEQEDENFIPVDNRFYAKWYNEGGQTFTLQDILRLIPPQLTMMEIGGGAKKLVKEGIGHTCIFTMYRDNEYCTISYSNAQVYIPVGVGRTILEAAFNALCYLLENELVK